jgi:hypothetical protein
MFVHDVLAAIFLITILIIIIIIIIIPLECLGNCLKNPVSDVMGSSTNMGEKKIFEREFSESYEKQLHTHTPPVFKGKTSYGYFSIFLLNFPVGSHKERTMISRGFLLFFLSRCTYWLNLCPCCVMTKNHPPLG